MRLFVFACCMLSLSIAIGRTVYSAPLTNAAGIHAPSGHVSRSVTDLAAALLNGTSPDTDSSNTVDTPHVPKTLLIKFKEHNGGSYSRVADLVNEINGIEIIKVMAGTGIAVVTVTDTDVHTKALLLAANELVEYIELDHLMGGDGSTLQPSWSLHKLQVSTVWQDYTFGSCGIVVCHIDSGMPRSSNSWFNPGEYAGVTGVDDDGNGVIDDYWGANFLQAGVGSGLATNDSSDMCGHGTGTAASLGGPNDANPNAALGASPKVSIMACKAMDSNNLFVPLSASLSCMEWCKTNYENMYTMGGAQRTGIYVAPWGSDTLGDSNTFRAEIQRVDSAGKTRALFTAAAGNSQSTYHVPASLGLPNVLALTFSNQTDQIRGNTGSWVDTAVPCGSSSDAAAMGGGLAALMLAANPALTPEQIRAAFLYGVEAISSMQGQVGTNGRLNAQKAFGYLQSQGLVQKAVTTPDQSQLCVPQKVWFPPWPASRLACSVYGDGTSCWTSSSSRY